jgi:hypothetical protein
LKTSHDPYEDDRTSGENQSIIIGDPDVQYRLGPNGKCMILRNIIYINLAKKSLSSHEK